MIQAALARLAGRVGRCAELPPSLRLLLAELVRSTDHRQPDQSVRVRNATLATALGTSERSIARLKHHLEAAGWIRRHQIQSRRRGMQVADCWFTPLTLEALGLLPTGTAAEPAAVPAPRPGRAGAVEKSARRCPQPALQRAPAMADAFRSSRSSSKRQPAPAGQGACGEAATQPPATGAALSDEEIALLRTLQARYGSDLAALPDDEEWLVAARRRQQAADAHAVPADLRLLHDRGLPLASIRKLMGLASRRGVRLGDVVAACARQIAQARHAFAYVLRLLATGRDWAWLARQGASGDSCSTSPQAQDCPPATPTGAEDARRLDALRARLHAGGVHSHAARTWAWRVVDGIIYQARLRDLADGAGEVGRAWRPLARPIALAHAAEAGQLVALDPATLDRWVHDAAQQREVAPAPAGLPPAGPRTLGDLLGGLFATRAVRAIPA